MKLFVLLFFSFGFFNAISQNSGTLTYEETRVDSTNTALDSVLILGVGFTSSRIFLDNLSEKIIKKLQSVHVKSEYRYLGKTMAEAREDFNLINLNNYKALLLFLPKDSAFFEVKITKLNISVPMASRGNAYIYPTTTSFIFQGNFDIQLYNREQKMKLIWAAFIDVNSHLTKTTIYSRISKKIIASFKKNKYIR